MTDAPNRDRFIQFRKTDIIAMCCDDSRMDAEDVAEFREFCRILGALFHFEFHGGLETLKNCYAPFSPDADTRPLSEYLPEHKEQLQKELVAEMTAVLNSANFEKITAADLEQALAEEWLFKIRLELVTREGNVVQCRPLSEAKRRLDYIWDNYFTFNSN